MSGTGHGSGSITITASAEGKEGSSLVQLHDWSFEQIKDEISGVPFYIAHIGAETGPTSLYLRCKEGDLEIYVTGDAITADGDVRYRLDSGSVVEETWDESKNFHALFYPSDTHSFAETLAGADTLHFEYREFAGGPITSTFAVRGLEPYRQKLVTSCPGSVSPPPPQTGSIIVSTITTGSDPDGYQLSVDGGTNQPIQSNATIVLSAISAGSHSVLLTGLDANCSVAGANPAAVVVTAGGSVPLTYRVTCSGPPPAVGLLRVTTTTAGQDLDADGYKVAVDGGQAQAIGVNDQVELANISVGAHTAVLSEIASNCSADNASKTATVTAGATATVAFTITCTAIPPAVGSVRVTTTTTGSNPDADGYQFAIDAGTAQHIDPTGSLTVPGIPTGSHRVVLSNVAANCSVAGGTSENVTVTEGQITEAAFAIDCPAPQPSASRSSVVAAPKDIPVGTGSSTITVTVKDAGGALLPGITVTPTSSGDGNTLTPVSATTDQQGKAVFTFASTVAGNKTITATAGGVILNDTEVITVFQRGSTTDITSITPEPSTTSEGFDVTVKVTAEGGGTPTGTVAVFSFAVQGGCDAAPLDDEGIATCSFPTTPAGTYRIEAAYSGDDQFEDSSDPDGEQHVVVEPATSNQRAAR